MAPETDNPIVETPPDIPTKHKSCDYIQTYQEDCITLVSCA